MLGLLKQTHRGDLAVGDRFRLVPQPGNRWWTIQGREERFNVATQQVPFQPKGDLTVRVQINARTKVLKETRKAVRHLNDQAQASARAAPVRATPPFVRADGTSTGCHTTLVASRPPVAGFGHDLWSQSCSRRRR